MIAAIVGGLVLVGGIGAFVATRGDDPPKDDGAAKVDSDKGDKGDKAKDDDETKAKDKDKDKDKVKPAKKDPLDALVGSWETDTTNRALKAVREGDEVLFRVVKASDWDGAYADDEVRFKLKAGVDDKTFEVVDRYRPPPGKGIAYSKSALAGCILESSGSVGAQALEAVLKSETSIEVTFAKASVSLIPDPGDPKTISGCKTAKANGTVKSLIKKKS